MRKWILFIFLTSVAFLSAQPVLYVSPQGDDNKGKGTRQQPFASLQRAYQHSLTLKQKDTLYIRLEAGRYELQQPVHMTQTPRMPLVVEGSRHQPTVLSGAVPIKHWKQAPQGWWTAYVPEVEQYGGRFEQFYVNGQRAIRARTPDYGEFKVSASREWSLFGGNPRTSPFAVQRYAVAPSDLRTLLGVPYTQIREMTISFLHKWSMTRRHPDKAVVDSGYLFTSGLPMERWNPIQKGSRLFLENYKNALSMPGEWFLEKTGTLYYIPRKGENIAQLEAYVPVATALLCIKGSQHHPVKNITFRNLQFEYAGYRMPVGGNAPVQSAADIPAAIQIENGQNIHFSYCSVRHTGQYAVSFANSSVGCSWKHSTFTDLGAGAFQIGETQVKQDETVLTRGICIAHNRIQHTGCVFPNAAAILLLHAANNQILHNELSDMDYTAISLGWFWKYSESQAKNNEVAYNHIHHVGRGRLSDMGGIYALGTLRGTRIHHNVIHDVEAYDYGGWGIYLDEACSYVQVANNLVYNCVNGAFHQHYGKENEVYNNIFALGTSCQLQLTKAEPHTSLTFRNNIVLTNGNPLFKGQWKHAKVNMHDNLFWDLKQRNLQHPSAALKSWVPNAARSVCVDPQFVQPLEGDFRALNAKALKTIHFIPFDVHQ